MTFRRSGTGQSQVGGARPALLTALGVTTGLAILVSTAGFADGHAHVAGAAPVVQRLGDVDFVVDGAVRLADGHAGANSPKLPMGGPAMPMAGSGHIQGATHEGEERISVAVRFRNRGTRPVSYDALDIQLLASGRPAELLRPVESTLGAGLLPAGARIAGSVYFVVKDGTHDLTIRHVASTERIRVPDDVQHGASGGASGEHGH